MRGSYHGPMLIASELWETPLIYPAYRYTKWGWGLSRRISHHTPPFDLAAGSDGDQVSSHHLSTPHMAQCTRAAKFYGTDNGFSETRESEHDTRSPVPERG